MLQFSDLQYLAVPLPEDLARLKGYGDFDRLLRVMDDRLSGDLPHPLKKRLELEKRMIQRTLPAYPYTEAEALAQLQSALCDFEAAELSSLRDQDAADWMYQNGEIRYRENFLDNLLKTRPALAARLKNPEPALLKAREREALSDSLRLMTKKGALSCALSIQTTLTVSREAFRPDETLRVHLPIPVECPQVARFFLNACDPAPVHIGAKDYPQRTVYMEGRQIRYQIEYTFESHMRYIAPDPKIAYGAQPTFYTEEHAPHIVFTPYLKMLAEEIVGTEKNPLRKARRIYDYVTSRPIYSFVRPYSTIENLPGYMATGFKGDCGIFALLFITLCRICKVPARWQSGLYATENSVGCHDWAQFYIAPYGWLFADCSFGGSAFRMGDTARRDFYFGNLDPFRVPAATEFQHEFYPPRTHLRIDPYDNQLGEAEYADHGLEAHEFETTHTVTSFRPF